MIDCFVQSSDFMPWRRNVQRGHILRESETAAAANPGRPAKRQRRRGHLHRPIGYARFRLGTVEILEMRTMKFDHSSNRNKPFCKSSRMT
uniref:Uncharacterized protein n=1 Tax=Oryza nivara TaxID=4536 RepID=A0A0E0HHK3_ORYNI